MENPSKLVEAINACASQLDHLNNLFPHLATTSTLQGVEQWQSQRDKASIQQEEELPEKPAPEVVDIRAIAVSLVAQNTLEDVLDLLLERHDTDLSLAELVHLVGRKTYVATLKRDLQELLKNAISYEQIANLWNDLDRPALGKTSWNSRSVSLLDA